MTGDKNVGAVTDGIAEGVGGQFGSGGLLRGVGELSSKEGFNRAERGDLGPLEAKKLEEQKGKGKSWGESVPVVGGLLGGGKK